MCIFVEGKLVDFIEVERETRSKRHVGLKSSFILDYLDRNDMTFEIFDAICISGTQQWGLWHDEDLEIEYGFSQQHKLITTNFIGWNSNNNILEYGTLPDGASLPTRFPKNTYWNSLKVSPSVTKKTWQTPYFKNLKFTSAAMNSTMNKLNERSKGKQNFYYKDFFMPLTIKLFETQKPGFYIDHHAAHAHYAAYYSKGKSIIVTHDGGLPTTKFGPKKQTSFPFNSGGIYLFQENTGVVPLVSHNLALGYLYDNVAHSVKSGLDAGKLMGLASYGRFSPSVNFVTDTYINSLYEEDFSKPKIKEYVGHILALAQLDKNVKKDFIKKFKFEFNDVLEAMQNAADIQYFVQRTYVETVSSVCEMVNGVEPSFKNVFMTGGFSLNCPTNSAINHFSPRLNYIPLPGVADTGISLGGAVALHFLLGLDLEMENSKDTMAPAFPPSSVNPFSGKQNFNKLDKVVCETDEICNFVAKELAEGKIFCIHRGRSEVGPRALGH